MLLRADGRIVFDPAALLFIVNRQLAGDMYRHAQAGWHIDSVKRLAVALAYPVGGFCIPPDTALPSA